MTTLHVSGPFPHFHVVVFTRNRICYVFKSFHSGERFEKFAVTVCVFAGYVWSQAGSVTKCLRMQTNPDTCGQGLIVIVLKLWCGMWEITSHALAFNYLCSLRSTTRPNIHDYINTNFEPSQNDRF